MSKTLQVKVKVSVLIEALKSSLSERAKRFAENEKLEAEHAKAVEAYNANLTKLIKDGKGKLTEASKNRWQADRTGKTVNVEVAYEFPASLIGDEPESPELYKEWEWKRDREALEQAIRVLEMTDDEYVAASTLKSVAEYL